MTSLPLSLPLLDDEPQTIETHSNVVHRRRSKFSNLACGVSGALLGFFVRMWSLQASRFVSPDSSVLYFLTSEADLILHVAIWLVFFGLIMVCKTENGRRILASAVLRLMIGVIIGSYSAWNFVDMSLGYQLSYTSRLAALGLMLLQCGVLYRCHQAVCSKIDSTESKTTDNRSEDLLLV